MNAPISSKPASSWMKRTVPIVHWRGPVKVRNGWFMYRPVQVSTVTAATMPQWLSRTGSSHT